MKIDTLKRRAQFQRVRGGARWAGPLFIIEGRQRRTAPDDEAAAQISGPRFGFTITRKVGGAVVRNRVRRRLREALRTLGAAHVRPDYDYVVVASRAAHDYPFAGLQDALRDAFERLHRQADGGQQRVGPGRYKAKSRRGGARPSPDAVSKTGRAFRSSDGLQPSPEADESKSGNDSGPR
jgi:ribonuclease P protein component